LKNLFSNLRYIMESLKVYPDSLNDWMLSNHNYIKTDSPSLKDYLPKQTVEEIIQAAKPYMNDKKVNTEKYTVKVKTDRGEEEVQVEKIQDEDKTNEFFKRAEAVKPNIDGFKSPAEKTQHLKGLVQQIKRGGAPVVNESGNAEIISPEMLENADPESVAGIQALIEGSVEINSSLSPVEDGGDDDIPPVVLAMAKQNQGKSSDYNAKDLQKLQELQARTQAARRNVISGSKGAFSRGS
jgi:hypothetical protein